MSLLTWEAGRQQDTNYHKMQLYKFKVFNLGFDSYILKYEPKTVLPIHTDKVDGKHFRANINIKGDSEFECQKCIIKSKRLNIFRADKYLHKLSVNTKTYKLSFGMAILNKRNHDKQNNH